jgi:hypothetical protein
MQRDYKPMVYERQQFGYNGAVLKAAFISGKENGGEFDPHNQY